MLDDGLWPLVAVAGFIHSQASDHRLGNRRRRHNGWNSGQTHPRISLIYSWRKQKKNHSGASWFGKTRCIIREIFLGVDNLCVLGGGGGRRFSLALLLPPFKGERRMRRRLLNFEEGGAICRETQTCKPRALLRGGGRMEWSIMISRKKEEKMAKRFPFRREGGPIFD